MIHRTIKLALGLALGLVVLVPQISQAQGAETSVQASQGSCSSDQCSSRHSRRHEGASRQAWQQIQSSLTPEQQQQIGDIRAQMKEQVSPLFEQMKDLKQQLSQIPQDSADAAVQSQRQDLIGKMRDLRSQIRADFKAGRQKSLAILNPDQRAQLKADREGLKQSSAEQAPLPQ